MKRKSPDNDNSVLVIDSMFNIGIKRIKRSMNTATNVSGYSAVMLFAYLSYSWLSSESLSGISKYMTQPIHHIIFGYGGMQSEYFTGSMVFKSSCAFIGIVCSLSIFSVIKYFGNKPKKSSIESVKDVVADKKSWGIIPPTVFLILAIPMGGLISNYRSFYIDSGMGIQTISAVNSTVVNRHVISRSTIQAQTDIISIQHETSAHVITPILAKTIKKQYRQLNVDARTMIVGVPKSSWPSARLQYQIDEVVFHHPASPGAVRYAHYIQGIKQSEHMNLFGWRSILLTLLMIGGLLMRLRFKKSLRMLEDLRTVERQDVYRFSQSEL
jgi:hypothetical protein